MLLYLLQKEGIGLGKEAKTNAMRMLDKKKIAYEALTYEVDTFIDGMHCAELTGAPVDASYKTLVMQGKSKQYYVFVIPIACEVDLKKAARSVGEKSVERRCGDGGPGRTAGDWAILKESGAGKVHTH